MFTSLSFKKNKYIYRIDYLLPVNQDVVNLRIVRYWSIRDGVKAEFLSPDFKWVEYSPVDIILPAFSIPGNMVLENLETLAHSLATKVKDHLQNQVGGQ